MSGVVKKFESESKPGKFYEVSRAADGTLYCDCPKWRFQKGVDPKERTCKHILQLELEEVLEGEVQEPVAKPVVTRRSKAKGQPCSLKRRNTFWG
jgi:predicted nucleic acid-binding Zn finger protein